MRGSRVISTFVGRQLLGRSASANAMRFLSTTPSRFFFRDPFFRDPMALMFYDPLRPMRRALRSSPFAGLDHFFDYDLSPKIRENAAKLDFDEKGNMNTIDTSGYSPEELQVNIEGDEVVIHAEHKHETDSETVHRQFVRRVRIPDGFLKESVKCELDEKGRLCMTAPREDAEPATERRSIPIGVKASAKPIDEK